MNNTLRPRGGPGVLFAPEAHAALRRGIDCLADTVRPTLGPLPRTVAVEDVLSGRPIEVLDDAATIVRRIIEIPDHYVNMGAMLLRHAVWKTCEAVGDGGATTAVLFQALVRRMAPYLAAGGNPVAVRRGLEAGRAAAVTALRGLARPLEGPLEIARATEVLCHDRDMARLLGEVFDIVGADGYVQVEEGYTRGFDRQYVEGAHWKGGYFSPYFITDQDRQEARLEDPAILIGDLRLSSADQLVPLLERLVSAGRRSLLVIAEDVAGSALSLLVANHQRGTLQSVAVKAPSHDPYRARILEDLAILTGGRVVTEASGDQAARVTPADLGQARLAWATGDNFGLHGGHGDPVALRRRIAALKAEQAAATHEEEREQARERLGKLLGGVAIVYVGGDTQSQIEARKATLRRTVTALRQAVSDGVAPGGGAAYMACRQALHALPVPADERVAVQALAAALEEPLRVIARNAGYEPTTVVAWVKESPPGWGFDARTGQIVDLWSAGIVDPVPVLRTALEAAVSGAVMTLTAGALVHQREPRKVTRP